MQDLALVILGSLCPACLGQYLHIVGYYVLVYYIWIFFVTRSD